MASIAGTRHPHKATRRVASGLLLPILLLCAMVAGAVAYVSYVLWPRWPAVAAAPDAPALPINVGGATFNIPPAAIRMAVQRRPGAQERIDLAFLWPSLAPPGHERAVTPKPDGEPARIDRIFVTIAAASDALPPTERLRTIYPRYVVKEQGAAAPGLIALAFRQGSPYQGEDLIYEFDKPERFFVRCSRKAAGHIPGICLAEWRIAKADITVRFPREWLGDWRHLASGIDRLIAALKPR